MAWTTGGKLIEQINEAMKENDFQIAEDLLNKFKEKIDTKFFDSMPNVRIDQYHELLTQFNRRKTLHELRNAITNYDLKTAKEKLESLTSQKLIVTKEKSALESQLFLITEEGVLSQIRNSSSSEEKISLMEKYADVYSQGREIRRIGTDLLAESFASVINAANTRIKFEDLYNKTHRITNYLEKYTQRGINLSQIVPLQDFLKTVQDYLIQLKSKGPSDTYLDVGSAVRYTEKCTYVGFDTGRDPKIIYGFEGIVTDYQQLEEGISYCIVEVTQNNLEKTLETFLNDELEVREPITEIDRNLVRNELDRIQKLFTEHYSVEVTEKYPSQDFSKGINTLVSK
ncbi:hypothetical protein HZA97_08190 [Candidatus Woesearchaeota archaeon]|nr:hypothetical protein [Candidatus Woesearchaeota archaeon]